MTKTFLKSLKHGCSVFGDIMFAALCFVVMIGFMFGIGWTVLTLGSFLATKFSILVAVPVCFTLVAFLFALGSAIKKYLEE